MDSKNKEDKDSYGVNQNDVQKKKDGLGTKLNRTTHSIWNSSNKEFLGRTWDSWAKIGIFYVVFYSCLAGFFAVLLVGFFQTIDVKQPTQQNLYSLIKANPGMGFRPMPNVESTLIKFKQGVKTNYESYKENLDKYLNVQYKQAGDNVVNCTETTDGLALAEQGKVCRVGKSMFGEECSTDNDYSFDEGTPCVLLKINKVFGWIPRSFNISELEDPENKFAQEANAKLGDRIDPNYIGVSCEGENEADSDNMGTVKFIPPKGFPMSFYPYKNQENYRTPVVFVKFENPKYGALIQVWCRIWTANIRHHKNDKAGSIHFELLID